MGMIAIAMLCALFLPQTPAPGKNGTAKAPAPGSTGQVAPTRIGVEFDPATGWPRTVEPAPGGETRPAASQSAAAASPASAAAAAAAAPAPARAAASPLRELPERALDALGVAALHWRASVHGPGGEVAGVREFVHVVDFASPDRDRLEHGDGRVFARCGADVAAERSGAPWPSLVAAAGAELELYGWLARLPFALRDVSRFEELGSETVLRDGRNATLVRLQRRAAQPAPIGPPVAPRTADAFEALWDPAQHEVVAVAYTLASTRQTRRLRLEDWRPAREDLSLRLPMRRVFVDANEHPQLTLEIVRMEPRPGFSEREFRLR